MFLKLLVISYSIIFITIIGKLDWLDSCNGTRNLKNVKKAGLRQWMS